MDKSALLDKLRVDGDERLFLARVLDKQSQARRRGQPVTTDFLSPREQALAASLLRLAGTSEDAYAFTGGRDDAERRILCFLPDWRAPDTLSPDELPIRALRVQWRGPDTPSHRDLLGSLMGLGIVRGKIGDIETAPDSADVLVLESARDFLLQNWSAAGRVRLTVTEIDVSETRAAAREYEELRAVVSSARLDAVLAAGLRLSRAKAVELVRNGRVQLNWLDCDKPERLLQPGDLFSVRGYGRLSVADIGAPTRKGRTPVLLRRYR